MDGPTVIAGTGYPSSQADNRWQVAAVGDFNGDGKADVLWRNVGGPDTGALVVWLMDGTTIVGTGYLGVVDTDWHVQGTADFNGDGRSDILWRRASNGNMYVWMMDGPVVVGGTGYTGLQADDSWQAVSPR